MKKRYLGLVISLFAVLGGCDPDTSDSPDPQDIFVKLYGSTAFEVAEDVVIRDDGGFVIFGTTTSDLFKSIEDPSRAQLKTAIRDFFVVFADSAGNPEQQLLFNAGIAIEKGGDLEATSIIRTSDGGYLLAGTATYNVYLDTAQIDNDDITAGFLIKLTPDGVEDWSTLTLSADFAEFTKVSQVPTFGLDAAPISHTIQSVIETNDGNFVLIGSTTDVNFNKPDFDKIADVSDIWVVKFLPSGFDNQTNIFERRIGFPNEDRGIDIFEHSDGSLVLIANGPGKEDAGVDDVLYVSSDANVFNNNFSEFTSTLGSDDKVNDVTLLSNGGLAVIGTSITEGKGFLLGISKGGNEEFFKVLDPILLDPADNTQNQLSNHTGIGVTQMNNGNLAVIGTALDIIDDNGTLKANEVLFYNADAVLGNLLDEDDGGFVQTFGGNQDDVGQSVMQLPDGRFILLVTIDFESNSTMIGLMKTSATGDLVR